MVTRRSRIETRILAETNMVVTMHGPVTRGKATWLDAHSIKFTIPQDFIAWLQIATEAMEAQEPITIEVGREFVEMIPQEIILGGSFEAKRKPILGKVKRRYATQE